MKNTVLHPILPLILMGCFLCGCGQRVELFYINKNDSSTSTNVSDCFVRILAPAGERQVDYNKKEIFIFFRNKQSQTIVEKEITFSAPLIKPKIDWQGFPKVKVSLISDDQQVDYIYTLGPDDGVTDRTP